ncbi:MAG: TIGR03668 family PPOX class F420-dependent oxidoreductase [Chloroflexota bacterium]
MMRWMLRVDDWAFLEEQRVGRLATADAAGRPHVIPVCFARAGGRLYVPVDAKPKRGDPRALRRLRNLRARPEAALLLDRYDEDWRRLRWLLIYARALILDAEEGDAGRERAAALAALEARYAQYTAMGLAALGLPVVRLEPTAVRRWSA